MEVVQSNEWEKLSPMLANLCFPNAEFKEKEMAGFNFSNSILIESNFSLSNLKRANFSGATLTRALFYQSDLRFVNFKNAYLVKAMFINCDLSGADFTNARMEGCCYPLDCNGFYKVKHSINNIKDFLTLFQILKGVDKNLIEAISPWFNPELDMPDE